MWNHKKVCLKLDENENKFPIEILNITDITELEIIGGNFSFITSFIEVLNNLEKLTIVSTKISEFPKEIFELPKCKYLSLKNNRIQTLPQLTKKSSIETLILNKNYISEINHLLEYMPNLKILDLGSNLFQDFPLSVTTLSQIKRLNFESNRLTTIPSSLQCLNHLNHLNLDNNRFSILEKSKIHLLFNIQLP